MSSHIHPLLFALAFSVGLASLSSPAFGQDKKDAKKDEKKDTLKQKEAIAANLKKAELKAMVTETDNFIIVTTVTEEKAKALGAVLEKVVPVARKALQFEDKEEAWKGKLAVYFLPEGRDFKGFIRSVIGEQPNGVHYALRSDEPFIVDPVDVPGKPTEADQFANSAAIVAGAFLKARASTAEVPDWLRDGFGRVTAMRAEGITAKRYTTYKAAAKGVANGNAKGAKPAAIADLWGDSKPASADVLANSLTEYIAYGPGAKDFTRFVYGFRPNENGGIPTVAQAFEAAGWKDIPALEKTWQKWVNTGK